MTARMKRARARWGMTGLGLVLIATASPEKFARAVGLEGDAGASRRIGVGVGTGWDQVAGVGRDAYPVVELYAHADVRLLGGLALGAGLGLRRDLADYNFALGRWRHGSSGLDAQIAIGYDGHAFHLSVGPALVGEGRNTTGFQVGILPLGTVRLRVGPQDGWNVGLRLIEAQPRAAGGGTIGARLDLGLPPSAGLHHRRAGVYASAAEATAGLSASDEFPFAALGLGPGVTWARGTALRLGCLLGTDVGHLARAELTCSAGLLF
jgi:hypothetical protein